MLSIQLNMLLPIPAIHPAACDPEIDRVRREEASTGTTGAGLDINARPRVHLPSPGQIWQRHVTQSLLLTPLAGGILYIRVCVCLTFTLKTERNNLINLG